MRNSSVTLLEKFQVRKSEKQKSEFIDWLSIHVKEYGYDLKIDKYSKKGRNLIIGDVENAKIILTAHYDTPPDFLVPIFMFFSNWVSYIISQFLVLVPLVIFSALVTIAGSLLNLPVEIVVFLMPVVWITYSIQIMTGFANKHTANDNTSGVATLLAILEDIAEEDRDKVCFVFFDQEELGLIGSSYFSKKYSRAMRGKLLINFDCVSDGNTFIFVAKKAFRESVHNNNLESAIKSEIIGDIKKYKICSAISTPYMSDQLYFKNSVGVVAAKKIPIAGYYIDRIHTRRDIKFDHENIETLKNIMIRSIKSLN